MNRVIEAEVVWMVLNIFLTLGALVKIYLFVRGGYSSE